MDARTRIPACGARNLFPSLVPGPWFPLETAAVNRRGTYDSAHRVPLEEAVSVGLSAKKERVRW